MRRVLVDPESVARALAEEVSAAIVGGLRTLVLAGGSTPMRAYRLLREETLPWGRVTVLFGDERCVPADDPDSNFRMARQELLDRVAPASVHRIAGELGAEVAAAAYDSVVESIPTLDLVLLGIGPDGHTASLFPNHVALAAGGWAVAVHGAPKPPPDRVSLTLATLRSARRVLIAATGPDKAAAVAMAERGEVPAGMIPGAEWLLDQAAAGGSGW